MYDFMCNGETCTFKGQQAAMVRAQLTREYGVDPFDGKGKKISTDISLDDVNSVLMGL